MNLPTVTVAIISYNHEKYIVKTIESILAQTYKNIEIIIVDNGSTDNSINLIERLFSDKVRLIINKDNGICKAMNIALHNSSGKYFILMASDDIMTHYRIEKQVEFLECNQDIAGCFGNMLAIDENDQIHKKLFIQQVYNKEWTFEEIFTKRINLYSPTWALRVSMLKELGGFNQKHKIEDISFYFNALSKGYKFYTMNYLFTFYRQHANNTHTKFKYMFENRLNILKDYIENPLYKKGLNLIYLEHFSVFGSYHKLDALKLLPKVITKINSKYLYLGIFRLFFDWRFYGK